MLSQDRSQSVSLKPFLNHYGETSVEQIEKNRGAIELLESWLSEEVPATEVPARQSYLSELKRAIDSHRLPDSQLYSAE
jgi:hypothetical protein